MPCHSSRLQRNIYREILSVQNKNKYVSEKNSDEVDF